MLVNVLAGSKNKEAILLEAKFLPLGGCIVVGGWENFLSRYFSEKVLSATARL